MAARCAVLGKEAVRGQIDHLRTVDGVEIAERTIGAAMVGYQEGAEAINALARDGLPLRWIGSAAAVEGLHGEATSKQAAMALVHGRSPATGSAIRTNVKANASGHERVAAYGLVFAAPKTVSCLLASFDPQVQQAAKAALDEASQAALGVLEATLTVKRGRGGYKTEHLEGLLGVAVNHFTSSSGEPHLHTHMLVAGSALTSDNKWRALDQRVMIGAKTLADAAFQDALRRGLERRLDGLQFVAHQVGATASWEIEGLEKTAETFSSARQHMAEIAAQLGREQGNLTLAQDALVWRLHRQDTDYHEQVEHAFDAALQSEDGAKIIREKWNEALTLHNATGNLHQIRVREQPIEPKNIPIKAEIDPLAFCHTKGYCRPIDLVAAFISYGHDLKQAKLLAAQALQNAAYNDTIKIDLPTAASLADTLVNGSSDTNTYRAAFGYTTKLVSTAALEQEKNIEQRALSVAKRQQSTLTVNVTSLTPDQAQAVAVIAQGRALTAITGVAGAGKTHLLKPVVDAAQHKGERVIVLARNAKTALEDGEALGVPATTLADFTRRTQQTQNWQRETTIVLEEAGLVDREHWQHLLNVLERNPNARLIAIGDRLQIQPIDDLATWAVIEKSAQKAGAAASLTETYRCKAWEAEHDALRAGQGNKVFEVAKNESRIRTTTDPTSDIARYIAKKATQKRDVIAIAATNEAAAAVSDYVQYLRGAKVDKRTTLRHGQQCGCRDLVRTRATDRHKGIKNGDTWQVTRVNKYGVRIKSLSRDQARWVSHEWCQDNLELAYATTADSAQGLTVDQAVVLIDGMGRSRLYSAATRGRQAPIYFATQNNTKGAKALLTEAISQDDTSKTLAEIVKEQQRKQGQGAWERGAWERGAWETKLWPKALPFSMPLVGGATDAAEVGAELERERERARAIWEEMSKEVMTTAAAIKAEQEPEKERAELERERERARAIFEWVEYELLDNEENEATLIAKLGLDTTDYYALTKKFAEDWDEIMTTAAEAWAEREIEKEDRRGRKR